MRPARRPAVRPLPVLALFLALSLAACGGTASSAPSAPAATRAATAPAAPATPTAPAPTVGPTHIATTAPDPTEVPGGETPGVTEPTEPPAVTGSVTQTDWGPITDTLPEGFPVFPDAAIADPPPEPVSGAFLATAGVTEVATWYRDALEATGKSTLDLSAPLEDGSRVLDMQGDLPECRLQLTFRPEGGSTMITVLVAAGCAAGGG
jgi:hypothetical protein